jgi:hypothetical protein
VTVGRPRSSGAARTWLARALAAHPAAALAAAPLPGGGWAVATGLRGPEASDGAPALPSGRGPDASRQVLVVGLRAGRHPLVPSCLHAYLVLVPGATLPQLAAAEVTVTPHPPPPPAPPLPAGPAAYGKQPPPISDAATCPGGPDPRPAGSPAATPDHPVCGSRAAGAAGLRRPGW